MPKPKHIEWKFVQSIFSVQELIKDVTRARKLLFFSGYFFGASLILAILYTTDSVKSVLSMLAKYGMVVIVTYFFCVQPIALVLQSFIYQLPKVDADDVVVVEDSELGNPDVGVIILCHKESIVESIESCTAHFSPNQIFLVEYSKDRDDETTTQGILSEKGLFGRVKYTFVRQVSKTVAIYTGAMVAKQYTRLLVLDGNVRLPLQFQIDRRLLRKMVKAICYPTRVCRSKNKNILLELQALEFAMNDFSKAMQSCYATVLDPQISACLWDRSALLNCISDQSILARGDCTRLGATLLREGFEARMDFRFAVDVSLPKTVIGESPNLYQNQVRGDDAKKYVRVYEMIDDLRYSFAGARRGTFLLRCYQIYAPIDVMLDCISIPLVIIAMGLYSEILWREWMVVFVPCVLLVDFVFTFLWALRNYRFSARDEPRLAVALAHPLYRLLTMFLRWLAAGRAYLVDLPNTKKPRNIPKPEKDVPDSESGVRGTITIEGYPWTPGQERMDINRSVVERLDANEQRAREKVLSFLRGKPSSAIQDSLREYPPKISQVKDNKGNFLIHTLCFNAAPLELIKAVARESPPNPINCYGETVLHIALLMEGGPLIIQFICELWPAATKVEDCLGRLPLHIAASCGADLDTVKLLVSKNPKAIQATDDYGNLPLHCAAAGSARWDVAEYLIGEYPAAVSIKNEQGDASLHLACMSPTCSDKFAQELVRKGPSSAFQVNSSGEIPVLAACRCGGPLPIVDGLDHEKLLMEKDSSGNTALHLECKRPNFRVAAIQRLISANPETVMSRNEDERLPLHELCFAQQLVNEPEEVFVDRVSRSIENLTDADETTLQAPDKNRQLPLHIACLVRSPQHVVIRALIVKFREALEVKDSAGCLPLHLAVTHRDLKGGVVRLLFPQRSLNADSTSMTDEMRNLRAAHIHERTPGETFTSMGSGDFFRLPNGDNPLHIAVRYRLRKEVISVIEEECFNLGFHAWNQMNAPGLKPHQLRHHG